VGSVVYFGATMAIFGPHNLYLTYLEFLWHLFYIFPFLATLTHGIFFIQPPVICEGYFANFSLHMSMWSIPADLHEIWLP